MAGDGGGRGDGGNRGNRGERCEDGRDGGGGHDDGRDPPNMMTISGDSTDKCTIPFQR